MRPAKRVTMIAHHIWAPSRDHGRVRSDGSLLPVARETGVLAPIVDVARR